MICGRRFILRLLFRLIIILLALSFLRFLVGGKPLTLSYFMQCLTSVDVDFSNTVYKVASIAKDFTGLGDISWWNAIVQFLKGIIKLITLPIDVIIDLFDFAYSVVGFVINIIGFDIWTTS